MTHHISTNPRTELFQFTNPEDPSGLGEQVFKTLEYLFAFLPPGNLDFADSFDKIAVGTFHDRENVVDVFTPSLKTR